MKKLVLKTTNLLIILSLAFTSCQKTVHVKTNTELLTQASWKFDHASATGFGDVTSQIPSCYRDNIISFSSNGNGTLDESTDVCSPSNAGSFTWSFQTNETVLHLSTALFSGGSTDFTLVKLDESGLVISQPMMSPPPGSISFIAEFTFKH